jgi:hypothetical protein
MIRKFEAGAARVCIEGYRHWAVRFRPFLVRGRPGRAGEPGVLRSTASPRQPPWRPAPPSSSCTKPSKRVCRAIVPDVKARRRRFVQKSRYSFAHKYRLTGDSVSGYEESRGFVSLVKMELMPTTPAVGSRVRLAIKTRRVARSQPGMERSGTPGMDNNRSRSEGAADQIAGSPFSASALGTNGDGSSEKSLRPF